MVDVHGLGVKKKIIFFSLLCFGCCCVMSGVSEKVCVDVHVHLCDVLGPCDVFDGVF